MHTSTTLKHWMHHFHDGSVKAVHYTGHMLHEKAFWEILAILTLIAGVFAMIVFFSNSPMMQNYGVPYGPYY